MGKTRPSEPNEQQMPSKAKKSRLVKNVSASKRDRQSGACIRLIDPVADSGNLDGSGDVQQTPVVLIDASTQTIDSNKSFLETLRDETERHISLLCDLEHVLDLYRPALVSTSPVPTPDDYQLCPICSNAYEGKTRLPICFPCGHTLCKACAGKVKCGNRFTCPFDRREFSMPSDLLTVNTLLWNIHDSVQRRKETMCEVHGSPVISFCLDHRLPLCGLCMFEHKDHDCCLCDSPEAEDRAKSIFEALKSALEKACCRVVYWEQALFNFQTLVCRFGGISLATIMEFKRCFPAMLLDFPEELTYQQTFPLLNSLFVSLQRLIEKLKSHITALVGQVEVFPRLSLLEKLTVQVRDVYDSCEVLEYLHQFGLTIGHVDAMFLPLASQCVISM